MALLECTPKSSLLRTAMFCVMCLSWWNPVSISYRRLAGCAICIRTTNGWLASQLSWSIDEMRTVNCWYSVEMFWIFNSCCSSNARWPEVIPWVVTRSRLILLEVVLWLVTICCKDSESFSRPCESEPCGLTPWEIGFWECVQASNTLKN